MRNNGVMKLALVLVICACLSGGLVPAADKAPTPPQFAFWYEDWRPDTWAKLQPANVIIGVPSSALAEIHAHGGRALPYVTFYQSVLGREFLHGQDDLENVGFHTPEGFLPSAFGGKDNYVLCSNSVELRRRVLAYVDRAIQQQGYDGLFIDNTYLPPASDKLCDAKHEHVTAGERGGPAYIDLLGEVYWEVKKLNPAAIVMTNPGNPRVADTLRSGNKSLWEVSDYVLWESYGYSSIVGSGHDRWQATIAQSTSPGSNPHAGKIVALAYPQNLGEALYSFALARIFGFSYAANTRESDDQGGPAGVFLDRLPMALGTPTSQMRHDNNPGILRRSFSNGEVVANSGSEPWSFKALQKAVVYSTEGHRQVRKGETVVIAPRTAVVVMFAVR